MDFLSTLHFDVKLLLAGGAVALLGALFSATKKNEYRFMALFTVLMAVAGFRFHQHNVEDEQALRAGTTVTQTRGSAPRAPAR